MSALWALTLRELKSLWYSPVLYVVGAVFFFLQGLVFYTLLLVLNDPRADASLAMSQLFFSTFFYWFAMLVVIPMLTMRTFSEEKRTGSAELLLTAPVTDAQVVLSKFLGAWLAYAMLWAGTIVFFAVLRVFTPFDWGPVLSGYLGTLLLGAALVSLGVLASSLTRNQIISGMVAFVALLLLFSIGIMEAFITDPEQMELIRYFSLPEHMMNFAKGIIDTRPLVLYASITAVGLFLSGRVIGSPRWRA